MNEARAHDLLKDIQKQDGEWYLLLPSAGKAAAAMGCTSVGTRKATIQAAELIGNGWKARVFSAWEDHKQITRQQILEAVGVSKRTQYHRDRQAGTKIERNFSKSKLKADKLPGIKEHTNHKAPFVLRDGRIAWRLPDTRYSTATARGRKGRARKANLFIRKSQPLTGLSPMRQALSDVVTDGRSEWIRLFNRTREQRKATERKLARQDNARVSEIYQRTRRAKSGAVMWAHCPVL
jgi:hypothetical protein